MKRATRKSTVNLPPAVGALLSELPPRGSYWSPANRTQWLTTLGYVLQLYYPADAAKAASLALDAEVRQ